MRVTNNMVSDQVVFNMQRSLQRFMTVQSQLSSGRRINKPSDDPLGTLRDLDYRTELSKITQYRRNISLGMSWMATYDNSLADVKDLLSTAKEIALSMANDTYDATARETSAIELQSIIDQIQQLANGQLDGRYIFSGNKMKVKPLEMAANGAVYRGDSGRVEFEIESSMRTTVNMTGAAAFFKSFSILGEEADLNVGIALDTLLTDLHNGGGIDMATGTFTMTDANLIGVSATIDLNAAPPVTTVDEAITRINNTLTAAGMNNVSVAIGAEGNNLVVTTTPTGEVSTATLLNQLNSGAGINLNPGEIMVTDGAGINLLVDLSSAGDLDDVINEFNSQLVAAGINNVTMGINATNTGLVINDTNGVPLGLSIENGSSMDTSATDLGITGSIGASLTGSDLNPQVSVEIAETTGSTAADLGLMGTVHLDTPGTDLDAQLNLTSRLADLMNGTGTDVGSFMITQGERNLAVDLSDPTLVTVDDLINFINTSGLDVTASVNASGRGIQIENNDGNRTLTIEEIDNGRAAKSTGLYGSSDMIGSLLVTLNALRNNDIEGLSLNLQNLDDSITHALTGRSAIGSSAIRLETTDSRLVDLELSFTRLLSEVEDADMTKVITDLATYENNYQAALMASAKIIQPSLLDFLR